MLCLISKCCSLHFSALEDEAGFDEYMVWNAIPLFIHVNRALLLILQDNPGVLTCMDNKPHGLQTGQSVVLREINGMEELNGTVQQVSGIISI